MAEKLSITIFLDGAAEIERQLEGIGAAGTKAFSEIGAAAEKVGGFKELDPTDVTAKLEKFGVKGKEAIDKITKAVAAAGRLEQIVEGVRKVEAGFASIGVAASAMSARVTGAFTAIGTAATAAAAPISRVARSFGLIGRVGAGGLVAGLGATVVGMENAADASRVLEGNLQALFRNAQAGTQFFNRIQQSARTAGTSLESTGKTMQDIVRTLQAGLKAKGISFAPGEGFKQITTEAQQLFDTLQKGMQLSGVRAEGARKEIDKLFDELEKKGTLSGDTLRKIAREFPQLGNALAKALGAPGQSLERLADRVDKGLAKIDVQRFRRAIKDIGPEIQTLSDAFDPTLAQRMDTIGGAWNRLLDSFGKSPAGATIKGFMNDIAKGLDEIAKKQAQVGKFTVEKPPETLTGEFLNEVLKTIETTKKEWQALVSLINQTKLNLGKVGTFTPLPAEEIAKEPAWVQAYLGFIEKVKTAFTTIFTPDVAAADAPEPAWVQAYLGFIERIKTAFKAMFTPDVAAEDAPEPAWVQKYLNLIAKVKAAFLDMFTKRPEQGGQLGGQGVPLLGEGRDFLPESPLSENIEDRRGEGVIDTTAINTALAELATAAQAATQSLQGLQGLEFSSIATAADSLNTAISALADSMQSLSSSGMSDAFAAATAAAQQLATDLQNMGLSEVAGAMQEVVAAANSAAQALSNIQAQGNGGGGFARGGLLGGRGTGTSDSNLAWVSRGEHIMPARAVRQPGVLAFLEALRSSGGSLRDVLDDMGRFALGGLVPRTIPAFASGGLAELGQRGGGRPIALTINAGGERQTFHVWADEKVADSVLRYATKRQVASAGRKSGAFG